ncbi:MAG: NFYB/HAP3 family transcription factor subunit [Methanophagales archaeon]|nr:NFYB/HAP3 family transcription factor subunit [Methanophagales archaeon]
MAELPIAPVTRLVRNAGAERVSEEVSAALVDILEAEGERIAKKAISIANRAKRTTVEREDIEEAKIYLEDKRMVLRDLLEANAEEIARRTINLAEEIAKRAISLANHANRKMVKTKDIEEAINEVLGG